MSAELGGLWSSVAHVAQSRVQVLEQALRAVQDDAPDRGARCARAAEEAHKLVGSLDSYGVSGGSALARRAAQLLEQPEPPASELCDVVSRLRALVDAPPLPAGR